MQRNIVETILGAVVLLVAAAFMAFFYRSTDIKPASGYDITAEFSQINGLDTGSPVRLAGVRIGQVTQFELDKKNFRAIVHMNIENGIELPADTTAVIESGGLLDGKFLTMQPGGDEVMLKQGDKITMTQASPSLEQLLGKFIFSMTKDKEKAGGDEPAPEEEAPLEKNDAPDTHVEEKPAEEKAPESQP